MLDIETEKALLERTDPMEFWSSWRLYLPLLPYIVFESLRSVKRTSLTSLGFGSIASANPGIHLGGLVGESKTDILRRLDSNFVLKFFLIPKESRNIDLILKKMMDLEIKFPVILKPDAGQRGEGVRKVSNRHELNSELRKSNVELILQEFHPGPFEAGIFYYRYPNSSKGRIFSITRKVFPFVIGNGCSSLSALIESHPRFTLQKEVFHKRLREKWDLIIPIGTRVQLCEAGNHCQGTLFLDGSEWITEDLENTIDRISSGFPGFYFGRYDIRFSSLSDFLKGSDLKIVELNGVTSESTNIYDPRFSKKERYSILFEQWRILFRIARESESKGAGLFSLLSAILGFYFGNRKIPEVSS